jgi:L-ascorbate metabolism protein UlaG (beta-lactamase superfamily)
MAKQPYAGPVTDHFDGTRFFVPGHNGDKSQLDLLKWSFGEKRATWPKQLDSPFGHKPPERVAGLRSTLIGHASFLVQVASLNILIDPVFAERASPVSFAGPKRVNSPGIAFADLPPIDLVLLTHNHYDHLDWQSVWQIEDRFHPQFIGPLGIDSNLLRGGKVPRQITTLDWGQSKALGDIQVHAVPTYHWSARSFGDRRKTLWCSFVITSPVGTLYHIGDTGYGTGVFSKQVKQDFGHIDLVHIPIGAYEPRWFMKDHHVNPEEAVQIFQDCGAAKAIGHHWGTFQLTNEAHDQPQKDLATALAVANIAAERFQAFRPGQAIDIT